MSIPSSEHEDAPTVAVAVSPAPPGGAAAQPGLRIGAYRLQRALGAGGMGEVWLAEQLEPVRRPVALKLMQRQLLGPLSEAYFEVERQALARMDHPAIAKVFDAGRTSEGHPWLVMEWIDGEALLDWYRERQPDLPTRLRLVAALARGVQHAHARGVLHRDLKPGNVLVVQVDGQPQPKLIDFGIALGLDAGPTSPGDAHSYEAAGSGAFMSPEQREGAAEAIDPRADVYALGMILLCLLLPEARLGALGEDSADPQRLRLRFDAALATGRGRAEPLLAALPRPLLQVLRCALAPSQAERYASAEALALDLERYLQRRPLAVMGEARGYRFGLFLRRHALAASALLAIVLALATGLSFALYGLREARSEAEHARLMGGFMSDVLTGVDPQYADGLDRTLLNRILDDAAERAEDQLATRPDALAEVLGVVGSTYANVGDHKRGIALLRQGHALATSRLPASHPARLRLAARLADALAITGEAKEAEAVLRPALAAVGGFDPRYALAAPDLRLSLAWALRDQGRFDEALAAVRTARAELAMLPTPDGDPDPLTAGYVEQVVLSDMGRAEEAENLLRPLLQAHIAAFGEAHARTLRLGNSLGVLLLQQRRYAEAEPVLRQNLAASEAAYGPEHLATLNTASNLAGALRQQGKVEESGPYYRRAYEGFVAAFGETHPRAIQTLANLGNYQLSAGDAQSSLQSHLRARELSQGVFPAEHPVVEETHFGAGKAHAALGQWAEALVELERALELRRARLPPEHPGIADVQAELDKVRAALAAGDRG
ncbi:serine/threonine-protein kinase [Aquimonas voraii]|uniref:Serine/threonine protein kinase n=1 Tax=Aquimonas voraii TaxID=265719 RepID=A0A1G6XB54_9GAMM|nr:serine/threonine-protein kinase [Aquimonas voraii]SDD75033.1 Serine/threonine protein kinase [Aquimonas voraii]